MLLRTFLDIFFPPLCHACGTPVQGEGVHLCPSCREKALPVPSPLCSVCGLSFATEQGIDHPCGPCLVSPPPFTRARSAFCFEGPVRRLIHAFKYGGKVHLASTLGLLTSVSLNGFVKEAAPHFIVPVPLHDRRLRERGFNQSQRLALFLSRSWAVPLYVDNLRRARWTAPQVGLSAAERKRNVLGAFSVTKPEIFEKKRLLLVDDVFTSGSTVTECSRTLKQAGAEQVWVLTTARALPCAAAPEAIF